MEAANDEGEFVEVYRVGICIYTQTCVFKGVFIHLLAKPQGRADAVQSFQMVFS